MARQFSDFFGFYHLAEHKEVKKAVPNRIKTIDNKKTVASRNDRSEPRPSGRRWLTSREARTVARRPLPHGRGSDQFGAGHARDQQMGRMTHPTARAFGYEMRYS